MPCITGADRVGKPEQFFECASPSLVVIPDVHWEQISHSLLGCTGVCVVCLYLLWVSLVPKGPTFCRFNMLFHQITVNQRAVIFEEELIFQIILLLQITCVNKAVLYFTGTVAKQAGSSVLSSQR